MNPRGLMRAWLVTLGLLLAVWTVQPSFGQTGITIVGADGSRLTGLSTAAELSSRLSNLQPRIAIEYGDANRAQGLPPLAPQLSAGLSQIAARIVLTTADANRMPGLRYPVALIGDGAPPVISDIASAPAANGVKITWTTDELATSRVDLGSQPGQYNRTFGDSLLVKIHEVSLTELTLGSTYYYRVSSIDRSGNTAQSAEGSFLAQILRTVYLPLVQR